ncbi:MAG: hypothetical protein Q9191_002523 [Dirinaria sp. TL-2023a]
MPDHSLQRSSSARSNTSTSSRNTPLRLGHTPSPGHSHRPSFTEQMRGLPPSPRANRHLSLSQAQIQDLLSNPPTAGSADPAFAGRNWQHISVGELVNPDDLHFVDLDTGVEAATNLLIESSSSVLLVRSDPTQKAAVATFDYRDLTQYLLFATGQLHPDEEHRSFFQSLAKKAQQGQTIPIRDAKSLGNKEPFVTLPHTADLTKAIEIFGGGSHRIVVVKEGSDDVVGVLSQLTLLTFLWDNGRSFPTIDQLYPQTLKDLGIGSQQLISINGDKPLKEALVLMNNESLTSLAVVDNHYNVIGNISNVDVKNVGHNSAVPFSDPVSALDTLSTESFDVQLLPVNYECSHAKPSYTTDNAVSSCSISPTIISGIPSSGSTTNSPLKHYSYRFSVCAPWSCDVRETQWSGQFE